MLLLCEYFSQRGFLASKGGLHCPFFECQLLYKIATSLNDRPSSVVGALVCSTFQYAHHCTLGNTAIFCLMCFPASRGVAVATDGVVTFDGNTLIPAESPPKGGAVLPYCLPRFVQKEVRCVCVRPHAQVWRGQRGLLTIIILKLHRVTLHYWRVAKPQFVWSLVLS